MLQKIRQPALQNNFYPCLFNMLNSCIGSGILALPYALNKCGIVLGTVATFVIGILTIIQIYGITSILDERQVYEIKYPQLSELLINKSASRWNSFFLITLQIGCCVSYLLFFRALFYEGLIYWNVGQSALLSYIFTFAIILPFIFGKNMEIFSKMSVFCFCCELFGLFYVIYFSIRAQGLRNIKFETNPEYFTQFVGVSIFAFEGIGTIFHIRSQMQEPRQFLILFIFNSIICFILYLLVSVLAISSLGDGLQQIVLLNIPINSGFPGILAKLLFALAKLLSYPLMMHPCFEVFETNFPSMNSKTYNRIMRVCVLIVLIIIASSVPSFGKFLNLIGGVSGNVLQFVFPSILCLFSYEQIQEQTAWKCYHWGMLIGSFFVIVIITKESVETFF